jgi:hypothetical protein
MGTGCRDAALVSASGVLSALARYNRRNPTLSARAARKSRTGIEIRPNVMYPRQTVEAICFLYWWDFKRRKTVSKPAIRSKLRYRYEPLRLEENKIFDFGSSFRSARLSC